MATAFLYLHKGEPALFYDPGSVDKLRAKLDEAMSGSNPNITIIGEHGTPITLEKSNIKSIEYRP